MAREGCLCEGERIGKVGKGSIQPSPSPIPSPSPNPQSSPALLLDRIALSTVQVARIRSVRYVVFRPPRQGQDPLFAAREKDDVEFEALGDRGVGG